jgi:hypothetical protein
MPFVSEKPVTYPLLAPTLKTAFILCTTMSDEI